MQNDTVSELYTPQSNVIRLDGESSIGEGLVRWLVEAGVGRKSSTRKFHAEVVSIIRNHIGSLDRPISALNDGELERFAQEVGHYAPSRWNLIVSVIRRITGKAKALKYRRLRFKHFNPPTQEEFQELLRECDMAPQSHCGLIVRFLALSGARINEARQIRWRDIRDSEIFLPGEITKNGKPRAIPILPGMREVLFRLKAISQSEFVLPAASIKTSLKKACQRAGVRHMSHHDFRHLFCTRAIEAGCDAPTIARWVGHQDGGVLVGKLYFHLLDPHSRRMAEKVRIAI